MPITTRSRATGIVKKVKIAYSADLSESESAYSAKRGSATSRRKANKLSVDSEFEMSSDSSSDSSTESASDARTLEESHSSASELRGASGANRESSATSKEVEKNSKPGKARGRLIHGTKPRVAALVEKLFRFPEAGFWVDYASLLASILGQISQREELSWMIGELSKGFNQVDQEFMKREIVNILLHNFVIADVREVRQFARSSCIGVASEICKSQWKDLTAVARHLLENPLRTAATQTGVVCSDFITEYNPL